MTGNKWLGKRYDGGHSPLGDRLDIGDFGVAFPPGSMDRARDPLTPGAYLDKTETLLEMRGALPKSFFHGRTAIEERTRLHLDLREWSRGDLRLEHPQGSSFHHLIEYEDRVAPGQYRSHLDQRGYPQIFVVERDWARAFAGYDLSDGEAPLPFPDCLFEFRISGVRVLAMYNEVSMFCVYGRGGVWVADDFYYFHDGVAKKQTNPANDGYEFGRVAKLVRDNVRVACIMVDANVATREVRHASPVLVKKRAQEGRPSPRDHYVVDLKKPHYGPSGRLARSGGAVTERRPQRGHFRRGTWVHYDDVDSGQVKYVDDGGFWHSRTWRNWHFAGDRNNIIEKEYRL